jgi:tetratricopeptide (TPR) repeat protein
VRIPAALAILVWVPVLAGQEDLVARGYQHFYNLQYDDSVADFKRQVRLTPDDAGAYNHLAQAILYRDMFRAGALESELVTGNNPFLRRSRVDASPEDMRAFDQAINRALDLSQARLRRNAGDTGALYAMGVSYGLRANYNFLVRKAWRDSLRDATSARRCHAEVTRLDPANIDARMVQGLHDYIVGSLPLHLRMLGFLIGFHGNKEEGIRTVELVASRGRVNSLDARILLCAIYRREKQPARAVPLLEELRRAFPLNYLFSMELAQMYGDLGKKSRALDVLERLKSGPGPGLERICFAEGNIQFWYNDLDPALENLSRAAAGATLLDLNTGVLAWMRLGQVYDLKGQRPLAVDAYRHAIEFAPASDAARESSGYLSTPYRRKRG